MPSGEGLIYHQTEGVQIGAGVGPLTWMAAIVRNLSIERLRAAKPPAAALKAAETLAANTERSDERALGRGGRVTPLAECLSGLESDERRLLRVAYFGGATYAALDSRDGARPGGAREAMRRALTGLRACLGR